MPNILKAIDNIASFRENNLKKYATKYLIRINAVGDKLEFYVLDAIAGTFRKTQQEKEAEYKRIFSWQGSQNNPPDLIIRGGDAFETKKIEGINSSLALNSSPPKSTLLITDPRLTSECRKCEENWKEKDIFYIVGSVDKTQKMKYLFFVQGKCYCANHSVYDNLHSSLKKEIEEVLSKNKLKSKETVELGGVDKVDPLGITSLRIRGMWNIENPKEVFSKTIDFDATKEFSLFVIMEKEKYNSFPSEDRKRIEINKSIQIKDIAISNPNDTAKNIDAKLISFSF